MSNLRVNLVVSTSLKSRGGIATVVNGQFEYGFFEKWQIKHIPTHSNKSEGVFWSLCLFAMAVPKIFYWRLKCGLGVAHFHMASRGSFLRKSILIVLCKMLGAKIVIHLHGAEFRMFYEEECGQTKKAYIRRIFNTSDKVVVLSSQWLDWIKTILRNPDRALVIANTVKSCECSKLPSENRVLFLGKLEERKGVSDLLKAVKILEEKGIDVKLLLGGNGEIQKYSNQALKLGITPCVEFLGWVSGSQKESLLASAVVYCLPSYNEGLPMGVLEAMSAQVAIVTTPVGGIPDAIEDKETGLLVEPGDIKGLASAIEKLLIDDEFRKSMEVRAKGKFDAKFSQDQVFSKLDSLYEGLLSDL